MRKKNTDENQINSLLLGETLKRNAFLVPDDYFSTLEKEIILKKNIAKLGESSFSIPSDYQQTLSQDILSRISEERLKESIPNYEFNLPSGYFNDLQKKILDKTTEVNRTKNESSEKDKSIRRLGIRKWIPYAAAASIVVFLGLFAILERANLNTNQNQSYSTQINTVSSNEIINYLAYYSEPGDLQYLSEQLNDLPVIFTENLSSQDIEAYLEYDF